MYNLGIVWEVQKESNMEKYKYSYYVATSVESKLWIYETKIDLKVHYATYLQACKQTKRQSSWYNK